MLKKVEFGPRAFRVRIELQNLLPPIWREILVPSSYSFWDLHVAIQDSMGWFDHHLHAFRLADAVTGQRVEIGIPLDEETSIGAPTLTSWEIPISAYLNKPGQKVEYEYDFGDGWQHQVLLAAIVPYERGMSYPVCIGGERACPPEDCGGPWGYQVLLEATRDPSHEEHLRTREWLGDEFDSECFDPRSVKFDDPKKRWKRAFNNGG